MRAFRIPALVVLVALLIGAVAYERSSKPSTVEATSAELAHLLPTASAADARSTTFYCAAGSAFGRAVGSGERPPEPTSAVVAEHTVSMTNQSDRVQQATVTAFPSEGSPVVRSFALSARSRYDLELSEVVTSPYASALVETDGGLVAVEHRVDGPQGHSAAPCASSGSSRWYFPTGTTRPGARQIFVVFNPFPDGAVLDLRFQVQDESGRQVPRETDKLTGIPVPAGSVKAIDITEIIAVSDQIATTIEVRGGSGRVIVDELLLDDGAHGHEKQLSVVPGAPNPADSWVFADSGAPSAPGVTTDLVLFNPGGDTVEADVDVFIDRSGVDIEPFGLTVHAGQYTILNLSDDKRIPEGVGYWAIVHSRAGGPVVAQRVQRVAPPAAAPGVSVMLGSPVVADRWIVPTGGLRTTDVGEVSIVNPSKTNDVTITVSSVFNGQIEPVAGYQEVLLAAGSRTIVDLQDDAVPGTLEERSLQVESTGGVVVQKGFSWSGPASRSDLVMFPVRGLLRAVPPVPIDDGTPPTTAVGPDVDGVVPAFGTAPGTLPPAEVPGSTLLGPEPEPEPEPDPAAPTSPVQATPSTDVPAVVPPDPGR